jgi:DNA-binding MarR family transcriptional regulator
MFSVDNEILDSFVEINKEIYKLFKKEADRAGLTTVQLGALYKISSKPNIHLGELAEKLRLTNSTVSGVIDRLVNIGLVERIIPQENRRTVSLYLTEKGKEVLENAMSKESIFIQKLKSVEDLPKDDIQQLLRLHKLILTKLSLEEE